MMQYHKLTLDNCTKYIHISGGMALIITDTNGKYSAESIVSTLGTETVKSLCNDLNKITKEDFEKVKEKVK